MKGVYDVEGKNKNPLNDKKYSKEYKLLAKMWSNLPAYKKKDEIYEAIKNNDVILVQSETGTGKSVIVPKIALHYMNYSGLTIMTLPKKDITRNASIFSAKTLDIEIGEYVGYQFRGENIKSDKTVLLYSTDGSIISMLKKDPLILDIDILIIDEAHERKVQIDLLLYLIKNSIKIRKEKKLKELKLIIMSATINNTLFENYYKEFNYKYLYLSGVTNYNIEDIYLENSLNKKDSYIVEGVELIKSLVVKIKNKSIKNGDILFFVPSISNCLTISEELSKNIDDSFIMPIYSGYPVEMNVYIIKNEEYKKLNSKYKRRIFISTNIAESSLTIDGIIYVIDSGLELINMYNSNKLIEELKQQFITKAQMIQRKGRAGRTTNGYCYHLYTKEIFDNAIDFPKPEILKLDLKNICIMFMDIENKIQNKNNTVDEIKLIFEKLIEPPQSEYIDNGFNQLINYNVIEDNFFSDIGNLIAVTNLDINIGLSLLYAYQYGRNVFNDILLICCILEFIKKDIFELFYNDFDNVEKYKIIEKFKSKHESEFVFLYNLYQDILVDFNEQKHNVVLIEKITHFYEKNNRKLYDIYKKFNIKIEIDIDDKDIENNIINSFNYGFRYNKAIRENRDFYYNNLLCDLTKNIYKFENKKQIIFYTGMLINNKIKLFICQ